MSDIKSDAQLALESAVARAGSAANVMPYKKYQAFTPVSLDDRQWPGKTIQQAPRWCSVDLRDGNQALIDPMTVDEKLRMWDLLLEVGLIEMEVGFPAASQSDFDFLRRIIEGDLIPEGVTIQVLCQARQALISRTVEALEGAPEVIFHLYNSTSTLQRKVVFGMDRAGIVDLAVSGTHMVREGLMALGDTNITFEYSPESFTGTELDFAVEISAAVADAWGASAEKPMIVNLPSTVEMATPNVYADQIEWFIRNFPGRERIIVSLHTHNDRGTGIAATELALMAGAQRVEGTLFGNGERTGNCDLVTMGMNMFSQGIDPQLDFSDMKHIRTTVEEINKLAVHERHPYAGDLVFTAFSGSHQDAIKKGMSKLEDGLWEVPYLPIDPADVGSSYKETVRVNSQSGKGGVGFILEEIHGVTLSKEMLVEFSRRIQSMAEELKREILPDEIYTALLEEYVADSGPFRLLDYDLSKDDSGLQLCNATIEAAKQKMQIEGSGSGPIAAFINGLVETLNEPLNILEYHEHALSSDKDAEAICLLAIDNADNGKCYGIGLSSNTITASLQAVISAMNRRWST